MRWLADLGIRSRLALVTALTSAIALLLAGVVMIAYDRYASQARKTEEISAQAGVLAASVAASLEFNDSRAAHDYLTPLQANPEIMAAGVYAPNGSLFASYSRPGARPPPPSAEPQVQRFEGNELVVFRPVRQGQREVGTLYLRATTETLAASTGRFGGIILLVMIGSLLITLPVVRRLHTVIVNPAYARILIEASLDPFVTLSPEGKITDGNAASIKVTGIPRDELVGADFSNCFTEPEKAREAYQQVFAKGFVTDYPLTIRRRDGNLTDVLYNASVYKDERGNVLGVFATARDVTETKRFERSLQEANRAKSDFLANMSHELRTPLNSIIGFSEMLKDGVIGELDTKQRGFVADIFDAGTHLLSLINDILDLSKVEAGMLQLDLGAVDVAALLKASTLIVREKALAHRIRLDTELDLGLGTMVGDERKLKQIVYNLLSNAVKFTPDDGAVTLRASRCARAEVALDEALPGRLIPLPPGEDGEFLAVTVEDTGVGIAEEYLPKLFEPFMQVDSSVARRHAGTGLGLSLVRRLVELHGGTVGISSRAGAGSRVCVWLPYREAVAAVQESGTVPDSTARSALAVPLALVIEDDDQMAELIAAQLRAEGFKVTRVATAEEGLVHAAKRKPQLITLDIFLPAMDGWEFMRRLNADPKLADTPVVIITASESGDRGLALGARRVLQKPFVCEELAAALAGLFEARSDGESARVLVVDDNVKAVELVATVLEADGYRVLRAYGGAEAIEVARSARPDLVILDLIMPEVSGFEVARALRGSEHTARIPILVLTAKDLSAEDRARLNDDVTAILAKSGFSRNDLLVEVRRALPKRAED